MKTPYLMLTLLIHDPSSPDKDIDVFLRPLVDELKELWDDRVIVKDSISQRNFKLCASLLWTINDFPTRSSLSGWSGYGYKACQTCNEESPSARGRSKIQYVGHRRWLPMTHSLRRNLKFNCQVEKRKPPREFSTTDIEVQLQRVSVKIPGKHEQFGGKKRKQNPIELNWTKKSFFFF